jgi:predicted RNA-binding Zn-ribbon protein involved in translation (DUF1610 family)
MGFIVCRGIHATQRGGIMRKKEETKCEACGKKLPVEKTVGESIMLCPDCFFEYHRK